MPSIQGQAFNCLASTEAAMDQGDDRASCATEQSGVIRQNPAAGAAGTTLIVGIGDIGKLVIPPPKQGIFACGTIRCSDMRVNFAQVVRRQ
jgi:hypothetical protein